MGKPELNKTSKLTDRNKGKQISIKINAIILFNIIQNLLPYNYSMDLSLILTLFLFLLPFFGATLNYWESIIFYGGIIFFLYISELNKGYKEKTLFLKKYLKIILIIAIISFLFSKNIAFSYFSLINLIFSFTLVDLILRHVKDKMIYRYLLYSTLLYSIIFILNKIGVIPLKPIAHRDNFILQVWGHSYLSRLLVFPITALFYQKINRKKVYPYKKIVNCIIFIFLSICLFLTNSRSAFITIFISFIYIIITSKKTNKFKIFTTITAILLTLIAFFFLSENTSKTIDGYRFEYWSEALQATINRPLFGQGPGNFFYISKQFQNKAFVNTNYAHNSFLEFLSTYGLIFTSLFYILIISALIYQKRHSPLNFILGTTGLISSFFESSWNSVGIFCISLFFIFYNYPKLYINKKSDSKPKSILKYFLLLFFISYTLSELAYVNKNYLLSVSLNPFNYKPRQELANQGTYLKSNDIFIKNYFYPYELFIKNQNPRPHNLPYFYKIIDLNPKESIVEYTRLSYYYYQNKDFDNLKNITDKASKYINPFQFTTSQTIDIAKISYRIGIDFWHDSNFNFAIDYLKKAAYFSGGYSHFQIELANAYWHAGYKDLALKQIKVECYKYPASIKHCQEYFDEYKDMFLEPGTTDFQDSIKDIK